MATRDIDLRPIFELPEIVVTANRDKRKDIRAIPRDSVLSPERIAPINTLRQRPEPNFEEPPVGNITKAQVMEALNRGDIDFENIGSGNRFGKDQLSNLLFRAGEAVVGGTGHFLEHTGRLGAEYTKGKIYSQAFQDALAGKSFSEINMSGLSAEEISTIVEARKKVADSPIEELDKKISMFERIAKLEQEGINTDILRKQLEMFSPESRAQAEQAEIDAFNREQEGKELLEDRRSRNRREELRFEHDLEKEGQPPDMAVINTIFDQAISILKANQGSIFGRQGFKFNSNARKALLKQAITLAKGYNLSQSIIDRFSSILDEIEPTIEERVKNAEPLDLSDRDEALKDSLYNVLKDLRYNVK